MNSRTKKNKEISIKVESSERGSDLPEVEIQEIVGGSVNSYDSIAAEQASIDETESGIERLASDHPIKVFMDEHDMILNYLNDLESINDQIQGCDGLRLPEMLVDRLEDVVKNLLQAEKHHQREEEVLFPEVVRLGMSGPPKIMELEHDDLRMTKKALYVLARSKIEDIEKFKERLEHLSSHLIHTLRDHIFKENNILYPTSLDLIIDQKVWDSIKNRCDGIGYCCFTPERK